ncbi:MAG: CDP-alcohol phosphatidyltransferase family protein [Bacteroidetes bacterium]|nr:CDP-alcohol phosphatidyltransferase family protein [Bacteroidota bacterium]MBP6640005.1 CDP-alcohol phosphatidyltransferase family protein [Bacteroidia bacterium]
MQRIRNAIPNLLTLGNLACGLVAIVLLMDRDMLREVPYATIGLLMVGAMAFDFADGFVARALKSTSAVGKELDSLSDLVSFGVLPGLMVYTILKVEVLVASLPHAKGWTTLTLNAWAAILPYCGLLIPLFSAYRLAKFNVDTRQSYGFLGLPTPANALFFLSIFLVFGLDSRGVGSYYFSEDWTSRGYFEHASAVVQMTLPILQWLYNPWVLAALTLIFSILLVTEIPLLAMKFKDYTWKGNWPRYVLILISVTLLAILWFRAIPLIIVLYFLFSFIDTRIHKKA